APLETPSDVHIPKSDILLGYPKNRGGLMVRLLVGAFVATAAAVAIGGCSRSRETAFYEACKGEVLTQLKAPATARFSDEPQSLWVAKDRSSAFLTSSVDAQNGYGALIRTRFLCGRDIGRFKGTHIVLS